MTVRVSADSTADLSRELLEVYDIGITPLYIIMGDRPLRDGIDCTRDDIFSFVAATGKVCSTSAVTVSDYQQHFERALETHEAVLHLTISSDMSACYQNACLAAEEFPERVFVIDSRSLSCGVGHLAIDAVLLAREGKTAAEIKAVLDRKKLLLNVSFVLDTLEYLHKGGRCSSVAALGANLLRLKPCIEVREGKMGVGQKYRGSLEKALSSYVCDRLEGRDDIDYSRIFLCDSGVDSRTVASLMDRIAELGPFREILHLRSGCTISNHCGPNCLGLLYYNKPSRPLSLGG